MGSEMCIRDRYSNVVTACFPPPSTLCPHQRHRNDLLLIGVSRASILPTVCVISRLSLSAIIRLYPAPPPLVFSANIRLRTETSFTTTRKLMKQHREHFYVSKSNDIDGHSAFPDSTTPKDRVRAQVRPPLTSLYTEHGSAVNDWPMPQQHSPPINSLWKRYPITQVQYANGYSKLGKGLDH